jgi:thiamine biosynthesis lipoprotein
MYYLAFRAMGCQMEVWLETAADGISILQALPSRVEAFEAKLSRFRPDSELSCLNTKTGEWVRVSEVMLANILAAKQGARLTDGLYNPLVLPALTAAGYDRSFEFIGEVGPSVPVAVPDWHDIEIKARQSAVRLPGPVDLGGIAKGWTASALADELAAHGPCLVNAGGDIVTRGAPEGRSSWVIAVAEPGCDTDVLSVSMRDAAIATSGTDYRRWTAGNQQRHHIIDPRTGESAFTDVVSATIIHPDAATAEVYAKAVLLLGSTAGLGWLACQWHAAGLVVRDDGTVLATHNWQSFLVQEELI